MPESGHESKSDSFFIFHRDEMFIRQVKIIRKGKPLRLTFSFHSEVMNTAAYVKGQNRCLFELDIQVETDIEAQFNTRNMRF